MTSFQVITIGFLSVIFVGSILLMFPVSSKTGHFTPFLEALFTATSATCVTGLVVHDTATYWSGFGQLIILLLIQTGGMGVVTVAVSLATISGKKNRSDAEKHHAGGDCGTKCGWDCETDRIYIKIDYVD